MITKLLSDELTYDGTQLGSRFMNKAAGPNGDAAVAFFGPADVPTENLVDEEDKQAGATIRAARMANVVIRLKGRDLPAAVAFQRLIMAGLLEILIRATAPDGFRRDGDDIYLTGGAGEQKLTVSIATTAKTGDAIIHIGVNVNAEGAPVPAVGLVDLGLNEKTFAVDALAMIEREATGISYAVAKVSQVE